VIGSSPRGRSSHCGNPQSGECPAITPALPIQAERGHVFRETQAMTAWTETYRGTVPSWQCDVTEHFTIAYYFDRLEEAVANFADTIGLDALLRAGGFVRRLDLRFARELRAGASFHVDSAALGVDHGLRLGHRFVDSATGEAVTWIEEHWELAPAALPAHQRDTIARRLATWDGPVAEPRPEPAGTAGFIPTARGRIKPGDLDATGHLSLSAMVHRFSSASAQIAAALGMDAAAMQRQRRGFSTFELTMRISGAMRLDAPYLVETGIGHLGNSSMRMIHSLTHLPTGAEIARLGQFGVNLDLDARRPARWPDALRDRAASLVIPAG
jgi:acyl-CoA thioesterase FadM